jgi:hypothetical protein
MLQLMIAAFCKAWRAEQENFYRVHAWDNDGRLGAPSIRQTIRWNKTLANARDAEAAEFYRLRCERMQNG